MRAARVLQPTPEAETTAERACWLALSQGNGLGITGCWNLVDEEGSARAAWRAVCRGPRNRCPPGPLQDPERLLSQAETRGTRIVTPADPEYPPGLLDLHDPPLALHVRGNGALVEPPADRPCVAVVGSRRATAYGLSIAEGLSRELAEHGVRVLSGLARGVDGAAHRGSLAGGGPTVAVLGCGLSIQYPREHHRLRGQIEACGAVVSEYPDQAGPDPWHFPARNRLLAAMAGAVVVVQAAERSGALITADLAQDLGREVLAVPGPVGWPQSAGCLQLLADGAALVRSVTDVLDALGFFVTPVKPGRPAVDGPSGGILRVLGCEGASVDDVVERCGLSASVVAATLVRLEVEGHVRRLPHGVWIVV